MKTFNTLDYYDRHAKAFYESTVHVEFGATQRRFLSKLQKGAHILDFGCGSGRDTKYFIEQTCRRVCGSRNPSYAVSGAGGKKSV